MFVQFHFSLMMNLNELFEKCGKVVVLTKLMHVWNCFYIVGVEACINCLCVLNEVLVQDTIPSSWCDTFFSLLHKGGCVEDSNNWRPVAILSIAYKIFARLVHDRIQHKLLYCIQAQELRLLKATVPRPRKSPLKALPKYL